MKRRYILANVGILAGCALIFATSATLMWFSNNISIVPTQIEASSEAAYYASGKGTKDDPYVINKARHLYNLAWLQYLGTYNKDEDKDGIVDVTYFSIEGTEDSNGNSVLDMSGWVLPPIGTEDNPFVGIINGNNTIIKNLTVSNTFSDYGTKHPYYDASGNELNENTFTKPSIIGFFGVIGGIDDQTYAYSSIKNVELVENLYLDNITIQNVKDSSTGDIKVLAGLLAGYVNAPIKNSGVGYGEFNFAKGTTNLASTVGASNISKVSEYSLIGAYNPSKFSWEGKAGSSGDGGDDWGSSIDMMTLNRRMNYISGVSTFSVNTGSRYNVENSTYGYGAITSSAKEMYWNNTSTTYWYVKDGTYLPLNVDTDTAFSGGETTVTPSGSPNSYHTTSYYQNHTSEFDIVSNNNSGYLVGRTNGSYADVRTRLQSLSSGLAKSSVSSTYDGNIKVYTVDTTSGTTTVDLYQKSKGTVTIDNSSTYGYARFSSVMKNFDKFMDGYQVVHGFHMVNVDVTSSENWSSPSFKVKILGKSYSNYQFVKGCLNFSVAKKGYITTLIGSFYGQSGNNTMFDLFSIERDSDKNIKSVTKINKIYKNSNGNIYYDPSDTNGLTLVFDFGNVTGSNVFGSGNINKAYYFELPVNAGDYAIGKSSDGYMSYLMYLDIGANAGDSGGDSGDEKTSEIDFVYYDNNKLKKINEDGYTNSKVLFDLGDSASGLIAFKRTYDGNNNLTVYYYPLTSTSISITIVGSGSTTGSDSEIDKNK